MGTAIGVFIALAITYAASLLGSALAQAGLVEALGATLEVWQDSFVKAIWATGASSATIALIWSTHARLSSRTLVRGATRVPWMIYGLVAVVAALVLWWKIPAYQGSPMVVTLLVLLAWTNYHVVTAASAPWSHAYVAPVGGAIRTRLSSRRGGSSRGAIAKHQAGVA